MIRILEVDQWTSTGNISDFTLEDFNIEEVDGNDAKAARCIFGGWAVIKEVGEKDSPRIGNVWFKPGEDGKLEFYKANYDSSD